MKINRSWLKVLNFSTFLTKNRKIRQLVRQLITALRRGHNMYTMRHWLLTTHLFHEVRVFLILTITCVLHRRFSIFSCHTILIRQQNKILRMVTFVLFHYMIFLNIFLLTLKTSKSLYII